MTAPMTPEELATRLREAAYFCTEFAELQKHCAQIADDIGVLPDYAQAPWQPIETAPKDGTPIRAYREPAIFGKHQCRVEVKWMVWPDIDPLTEEPEAAWVWPNSPQDDITSSDWLKNGDYYESLEFTHWQPLSVPPSNQGASK